MTGLASAIDTLHNFESKSLDVKLTGCHHDLAPRNILVQDDTLLLADFGLSTFRCRDETSLTMFKSVRGSYVAPEAQFMCDDEIADGQISRPSDIWSFGCILMEIFTYMIDGQTGLEDFRKARRIQITPDVVWYRFHEGHATPSSKVAAHMQRLRQRARDKPSFLHVLGLIQRMLSMNPTERPRSPEVLMTLRGIAILSLAEVIKPLLSNACADAPSLDYLLESFRFDNWMSTFEKLFLDITLGDYHGQDLDSDLTIQSLKGFQQTLEVEQDNDPRFNHQRLPILNWQSNKLIEALPESYRRLARTSLMEHLLASDHIGRLQQLQQEANIKDDEDLGTLLAVKHLTQLAEEGDLIARKDLLLSNISFITKCDFGPHSFALMNGNPSEKVIIEWLRYKRHWADDQIGLELRERLVSIAALLNSEYTSRLPGTLRCRGIEHNTSKRAFGFVYELPPSIARPMTLRELLETTSSGKGSEKKYRPLLEDRFRLAKDLCHSLYMFHRLGWLHRNIHSENVVFVLSEGAADSEAARKPYFLGFSGSRQMKLDAFTRGADDSGKLRNYHHPAYLLQQHRYSHVFDYYSIGMILLEIGLWSSLTEITDSSNRFKGITDEEFRLRVIERRVPQLGPSMGSKYMQAVLMCLDGGFGSGHDPHPGSVDAFKRHVLDCIQSFE